MKTQQHNRYNFFCRVTNLFGATLFILVLIWCIVYRGGFAWKEDPHLQFNWHILFMTIGMILMHSQSILIYRTVSDKLRLTIKFWHAGMHFGAFICSVIGLKAVFDSHNNKIPPITNMYTLHSWLGLLCIIVFTIQLFGGIITFLFPYVNKEIRKVVLPIHVSVGVSCFAFSIIASLTGLSEKAIFAIKNYKEFPSEGIMVNFIGVIFAIFGLLVLYLVNEQTFKRIATKSDEQIIIQ